MLVLGGCGFLGGRIAARAAARGDRVVVYDLPGAKRPGGSPGTVEYVDGDICDDSSLESVLHRHDFDLVVNTAAVLGDERSLADRRLAFDVNGASVWRLCELLRGRKRSRLIHVSTRSVYGDYVEAEGPLGEETHPRNQGFYGGSKYSGEIAIDLYRRWVSLDALAVRVTGLYGPGKIRQNFVTEMVRAVLRDGRRVHTAVEVTRELTYVDDCVDAVFALADATAPRHGVYNVSGGRLCTTTDVAVELRRCLPEADIRVNKQRAEPRRAAMLTQRIEQETGFHPRWNLRTGVEAVVEATMRSGTVTTVPDDALLAEDGPP